MGAFRRGGFGANRAYLRFRAIYFRKLSFGSVINIMTTKEEIRETVDLHLSSLMDGRKSTGSIDGTKYRSLKLTLKFEDGELQPHYVISMGEEKCL